MIQDTGYSMQDTRAGRKMVTGRKPVWDTGRGKVNVNTNCYFPEQKRRAD